MFRTRQQNKGCLFLVGFAILFMSSSCMLFASFQARQNAARAERLPVLTGVVLADSSPGREVIIEGRISNNMRSIYQDFVAYKEERRERDSDGDFSWVTEKEYSPPLLVDTSEGRVHIEKDRTTSYYTFVEPAYTATSKSGDRRYSGFRRDDLVMALGVIQEGSEGMVLDAEFIYGGTRNHYIDLQRGNANVFFWISLVLLGLAVVVFVLLLGVQLFRLVARKGL